MDKIVGDIKRRVAKYRDFLLDVLGILISIPTVNPPGNSYRDAVEALEPIMKEAGLMTEIIQAPKGEGGLPENAPPRYSIIGERLIDDRPIVHLNGHFDVVPITGGWTKEPFKMLVEGDRVYGRGSADMKGLVASMLVAVRVIDDMGLDVAIQTSFVCDEETGGEAGAGYLAKRGLLKGDIGVVEGVHSPVITIANKGLIWHKVVVTGKAAHSSRPHLGLNAFRGAVRAASSLFDLEEELAKRRTEMEVSDDAHRYITMNIGGVCDGGTKPNTICDRFSFTVDTRVIPEMCLSEIDKLIRERVYKALTGTHYGYNIELIQKVKTAVGLSNDRMKELVGMAFSDVVGIKPRFVLAPFFSDMRYLVSAGIPTIGIGCESGLIHGDDEWVSLEGLTEMSSVMVNIARHISKSC
ncbi:MAG: hypothetical protein DRH44_03080 [Candidatus Coatesbacteria bacterium]|nr:MAG: hypothetical protein DRH49_06170 [Candidatus Coatesbacteria bacterium]RLC44191.1 MAG: hypothetical protein DRH44_03080 [Candidatus Coatesbacteria bacterium]